MLPKCKKNNIINKLNNLIGLFSLSSLFSLKLIIKHCGYEISFSPLFCVRSIEILRLLIFIKTGKLTKSFFLMLHKMVARNINTKYIGRFRKEIVEIRDDPGVRPDWKNLNKLFDKFLKEYSKKRNMYPIDLAVWVHLQIVKMHPFKDANGRVAVLLSNLILLHYKYCLVLNFRSDIEVYEKYIKGVQKYISDNDVFLFTNYFSKNVIHNQILLIKTLRKIKKNENTVNISSISTK